MKNRVIKDYLFDIHYNGVFLERIRCITKKGIWEYIDMQYLHNPFSSDKYYKKYFEVKKSDLTFLKS